MNPDVLEMPETDYDLFEIRSTWDFNSVVNMVVGFNQIRGEHEVAYPLARLRDVMRLSLINAIEKGILKPINLSELNKELNDNKKRMRKGLSFVGEWSIYGMAEFDRKDVLDWFENEEILDIFHRHGYELPPRLNEMIKRVKQKGKWFRKKGEWWEISYEGSSFLMKNSDGLNYIQYLLLHPRTLVSALELYHGIKGVPTVEASNHEVGQLDELIDSDSEKKLSKEGSAEILDRRTISEYEEGIKVLQEKLKEADASGNLNEKEKEEIENQIDWIQTQLKSNVRPNGKSLRFKSRSNEGARQAVFHAIKSAIGNIKPHSPSLFKHLSKAIKTGSVCIYEPNLMDSFPWNF